MEMVIVAIPAPNAPMKKSSEVDRPLPLLSISSLVAARRIVLMNPMAIDFFLSFVIRNVPAVIDELRI